MKTTSHCKQNTSALAALLTMLIFSPVSGTAQGNHLASSAGQGPGLNASALNGVIEQLGYNGLMILLGAVVFMGLIWISYISKECSHLGDISKSARKPSVFLLLPLIGLCASLESCSTAQLAQAAKYHNATAQENRFCVCPAQHNGVNRGYNAAGNFSLPIGYSGSFSQPFCKHCGQRIFDHNH